MSTRKPQTGRKPAGKTAKAAGGTGTGGNTAQGRKTPGKAVATAGTATVYMYVGPALPRGLLKANSMFTGTMESVLQELEPAIARYPLVKRLLVPVSNLANAKMQIRDSGTLLGHSYRQLADDMKK